MSCARCSVLLTCVRRHSLLSLQRREDAPASCDRPPLYAGPLSSLPRCLQGVIETSYLDVAFATAEVFPDRILVNGKGRQASYLLPFDVVEKEVDGPPSSRGQGVLGTFFSRSRGGRGGG